jgi:GNAT superfamily N-acetyltransferase
MARREAGRTGTLLSVDQQVALVEQALQEGLKEDAGAEANVSENWIQAVLPGMSTALTRRIYRSVLRAQDVDARIAEVVEGHRARGISTMWVVGPSARPLDLGQRLLAAGFRLTNVASGMLGDAQRITAQESARVTVEPVDDDNREAWFQVHAAGWQMTPAAVDELRAQAERRSPTSSQRSIDLLARLDGAPAGIGSILLGRGFACLRKGVVLPEHRRKGVFRSLVAARISRIKDRGISIVTVQALKDTSAPLLRSMGFQPVCDLSYYEYP